MSVKGKQGEGERKLLPAFAACVEDVSTLFVEPVAMLGSAGRGGTG